MLVESSYTVDAGHGGLTMEVRDAVVETVEQHNFARVVDAMPQDTFDELVVATNAVHTYLVSQGEVKTNEAKGGYQSALVVRQTPPGVRSGFVRSVFDVTDALHEGAERGPKKGRMRTSYSDIHKLQINTYLPGTEIKNHVDKESGVAVVVSVKGQANTSLTVPNLWWTKDVAVAEFTGKPNEVLIFPSFVGKHGKRRKDRISHGMVNSTPAEDNDGVRQTIAVVYGFDANWIRQIGFPSYDQMLHRPQS